ncbi:MAG: beta galactosidase jelly roll domain-containing protein, partial [Clostridia bacterium]|nr:beta galactosidase jelly roll domain-containing protein [Clostridia bacterium]
AQNGTNLAMTEIFGVAGPGLTYELMRYITGYQAVRGINIFNLFNFPLGRSGAYLAQELPVFTEKQIYCRPLKLFNRYLERLSYIYSVGERVYETGLYYPVRDFQGRLNAETASREFDILGRTLDDKTIDFDIIDDEIIRASHGADGGCICAGSAEYKNIIIPKSASVPDDVKKILDRFKKGGGKATDSVSELSPVIRADGKGLRAMHRKTEKEDIFLLFRENGDCGDYRIYLHSTHGYLLDLMNGTLRRFEAPEGILDLSLAVGETAVILLTSETLDAESIKDFCGCIDIDGTFLMRKDKELICDKNGFDTKNHTGKFIPVRLGDWSYLIGEAYSGSCVYKTEFTLTDENTGKEVMLDLGDVHFAAEVYLNGKNLGAALMPPYRVRIPAGILNKENELKIVVTNTSANWYTSTDYFDKWNISELSPYFEDEKALAKKSVSGGLYGPVKLLLFK